MKRVPIRLGPLALLLTVISICLATLAILSVTTAGADLRLAEKYAETVTTRYALEVRGQEFLRELEETDPADYGLMDWRRDAQGVYHETMEQDGARLTIGFRPNGEAGAEIVSWRHERLWTENQSMGTLWDGSFSFG